MRISFLRLSQLSIPILAAMAFVCAPVGADAQESTQGVRLQDDPRVKQMQVEHMWTGAKSHFARTETHRAAIAAGKKKAKPGVRSKIPMLDEMPEHIRPGTVDADVIGTHRSAVTPSNQITNNKAGDAANAGQAEQHVAFAGLLGVTSWNDGQGFVVPPHVQGVAYTTDGGATWVDVGSPPTAGATGGVITAWNGDPVVAVNQATGEFYVSGLVALSGSANGLALVRATFPGGVFTWDTPRVIRSVPNATNFLDKEWITADAVSGNVYCTYTNFFVGGNSIQIQSSADDGATWSLPITLSSPAASGRVSGSRPEVDLAGGLYVSWKEIGPTGLDFHRARKSADFGVTFGAEATIASYYDAWGNGGPGFNRLRAVSFPAIHADRSTGSNAGRVYVSWHESVNFYDDPLGTTGPNSEVENNNFFNRANAFTPGQTLRGSLAGTSGFDYWSWSATAGTTYIFFVDSLSAMFYTTRVWCTDTTSLVTSSGDNGNPPGGVSVLVWTAPTTATYYFRVASIAGGTNGGYRVQTGVETGPPIVGRARDHRDAFVNYSDDGTTWSTPTMVNTDPVGYDNWLPEVAVGTDGYPVAMWYDWRDAAAQCGARSHIYTTRSVDGGTNWVANVPVTTVQTNWTTTLSNIAPNQGDYNGVHGGINKMVWNWADGRLGDVDAFEAHTPLDFAISCPADADAVSGDAVPGTFTVTNNNIVFGQTLDYQVTVPAGWSTTSGAGTIAIPDNGGNNQGFTVHVPLNTPNGDYPVCITASQPNGAQSANCCYTITVDNPVSTLASLSSASADGGRVRIVWSVVTLDPVNVYRSRDGSTWTSLGTREADGAGHLELIDEDVTAGTTYQYRLGFATRQGEVFAGDLTIEVPATAALALHGVRPNPTRGEFTVWLSLPRAQSASLELLDIAGRRVASRDVGVLGGGTHAVRFADEMNGLAGGVYTLRLRSEGRTLTSKVSFVR